MHRESLIVTDVRLVATRVRVEDHRTGTLRDAWLCCVTLLFNGGRLRCNVSKLVARSSFEAITDHQLCRQIATVDAVRASMARHASSYDWPAGVPVTLQIGRAA